MGPSRHAILAVLAVCTGTLLAAGPGTAAPGAPPAEEHHLSIAGKPCKPVGFEPRTDNVAAGIRARDVSCRRARRSIRRLHVRREAPAAFDCRHREHYHVLNHTDYRCERGGRGFSWQKY